MGISKVLFNECTVMDISDSTVTADSLLEGKKAYDANGDPVIGTMTQSSGPSVDLSQSTVTVDKLLEGTTAFDKDGNLITGTMKQNRASDTVVAQNLDKAGYYHTYTYPKPLNGPRSVIFVAAYSDNDDTGVNYTATDTLDTSVSWATAILYKGELARYTTRHANNNGGRIAYLHNVSTTSVRLAFGGLRNGRILKLFVGVYDSD